MSAPAFDFIPILIDAAAAKISVVTLRGVSTRHESEHTDQGRIYGRISEAAGEYLVELFSDYARAAGDLLASGSSPAAGAIFPLDEANGSQISGRGKIESISPAALPADFIAVVSFAVDADVLADVDGAMNYPGFDQEFGFAHFHAQAMKQILASALPAIAPHLYPAGKISAFAPPAFGLLPDVAAIVNPEALRTAQADLVRWLSAKQKNHLVEWKEIAEQAAADFEKEMARLRDANAPGDAAEAASSAGEQLVQFGSFRRG